LYFQQDSHWNNVGIYIAAQKLLEHIEDHSLNKSGK
jgi:hypothetical protein